MPTYSVKILNLSYGPDHQSVFIEWFGINNKGEIVGRCQTDKAFSLMYYPGSGTKLKINRIGSSTVGGCGINDSGIIVGGYQTSLPEHFYGYVLQNIDSSDFQTIGVDAQLDSYEAFCVNNHGIVTGRHNLYDNNNNPRGQPFTYDCRTKVITPYLRHSPRWP